MVALLLLDKSSLCQNKRATKTCHNYSRWRRPGNLKTKIQLKFKARLSSPRISENFDLGLICDFILRFSVYVVWLVDLSLNNLQVLKRQKKAGKNICIHETIIHRLPFLILVWR